MENQDALSNLLRRLLKENSYSIREFGRMTGIDHATISRILNGKRKANIDHLQKMSDSLDIELIILLEAAGYDVNSTNVLQLEDSGEFTVIQQLVESLDINSADFTMDKVSQEIEKYKIQSQTDKGRIEIQDNFPEKINMVSGSGMYIKKLRHFYLNFIERKGTTYEMTLMGAALLYFIVTTDLLPDYLFPIGFLDDALIVQMISQHLENKKSSPL